MPRPISKPAAPPPSSEYSVSRRNRRHGDDIALSVTVPDQHPGLAPGSVARSRQTGHTFRDQRRDDQRLGGSGIRLDLVVERLADRRRRAKDFAREPTMAR